MPLTPGARLGPYEVIAALGAGGMGEVYRARDTRLDRDVAIKVLPAHVAFDPEAQARFEREAKAVAALSHPNILAIHDVGAEGGMGFAVTELLNGETLRTRLGGDRPSALSPRKAADIAIQVARGLAAAHGKGIIHRDLKPENIFLTTDGHAKILDFGLAKALAPASASALSDPNSATQLRGTDPGTVMGTAGYMAPEQVRGRDIDHRADIFALGCVLYEMLSGHRAFQRETAAETMTSVLKDEPPMLGSVSPDIPVALDGIVRHCMEKQPDDRFQSARDLTFALESASGSSSNISASGSVRTVTTGPLRWPWAAATVAIAALTGAAVWWSMRGAATPLPAVGPAIRAELPVSLDLPFLQGKDDRIIALSPDGRKLASVSPGHNAIMLRDLETGEARTLVEGGEVGQPFFSPDGQFLAFVQGGGGTFRRSVWGSIKKIAITGGAATVLADGIIGIKGGDWAEDGYIYYCPAPGMGLWRAPADRPGTPERLTEPDAKQGEKTHRHPFVLPGGHAVLYSLVTSRDTTFDNGRIEVLDLRDRSRHRLVDGGFAPMYLPTGHLLYQRAGQLLAIKFDPAALSTSGAPVVVADGVANHPMAGTSYHTFAKSGLLMFIADGPKPAGQFVAIDRQGQVTKLAEGPAQVTSGTLSPDGRRLAIDPDGATQQIAIVDFARSLIQPLTFEWDNANPVWTPDGTRLVYRSNTGGGARRLFWQAADGSDKPEALSKAYTEARDEIPTSVFGKLVLFDTLDATSKVDVWILSLDDRMARPFVQTPFDEGGASFSPDGQWVSYQSNQSGRWEIWLQRYPLSGSRLQVSRNGGTRATWTRDGRSIVFQQGADMMISAISDAGPGAPTKLFSLEPNDIFLDAMRDGRILIRRTTTPPAPSLALIVNWFDHVRQVTGRTR